MSRLEPDAKAYARARRLTPSCMAREGYEGKEGVGEIFIVLVQAPVAAEPGEGASTTHRRGRTTKPFMSSLRLTISMRRPGLAAMALFTCQALYPLSAQTSSSQLNRWRILSKTRAAPSRSWIVSGVADHAQWEAFGIDQSVAETLWLSSASSRGMAH